MLQPRQTDNHGEVISNRRNAIEARRKLEPTKEECTILPSKFASRSKVSCSVSAKKIPITTKENFAKEDPAASGIRDTVRDSTYHKGRREESKIGESAAASRSQRDDSDGTASDAARARISNARVRDEAGPVQSELQDELNYRLTLHRLEVRDSPIRGRDIHRLQRTIMLQTEEKRLKVKIAEMAIQEIQFRIRALNEDIRRADELHELHLALATAQAVSWVKSRTR